MSQCSSSRIQNEDKGCLLLNVVTMNANNTNIDK